MEIIASNRVQSIGSYAFADVDKKVAELKKQGINPIDFGVGDPKDATPGKIRNYCKRAIDKRKDYGYPSYIGCKEYRDTIASWAKNRFNVDLDPETEISSSIGSKEAVFNFPEGILNPGDHVIIPNPGYPPWTRGTLFAEGKAFYLNLVEENNFLPDLSKIPDDIKKSAKIMWVNYPNNPTTALATDEFYKELIDFGQDNNIIIASDEAYTENYYEEKPKSLLEFGRDGVVVFQSLSKRSNMTGYRVGWIMGDSRIVDIFKKVKTNIDSGTATFIQDAASAALLDETHVEESRKMYKAKRKVMIDALKSIGLQDCTPKGTIYIWQKTPSEMSGVDFAKKLLDPSVAVVTTPGGWISQEVDSVNPGENYIRFALVPTINECKEAADKIKSLKF
jgi:LL-diaminopimelate aminotransferase